VIDKLDFYDVMATIVPGVLVVALIGVLFPEFRDYLGQDYNGAFPVMALSALSIFAGQLLVAFGSLLEPLLYWSWGGRPSDLALTTCIPERYLPKSASDRIRGKLAKVCEPDAGPVSLFLKAISLSYSTKNSRTERFNAFYAYHRTLVGFVAIALAMAVTSRCNGLLSSLSGWRFVAVLVILLAVFAVCWFRAHQRAFYFVREVLITAERELDKQDTVIGSTNK